MEYFTKEYSDLQKVEQLVQWFISKMASELPLEECKIMSSISSLVQKSIQMEIEQEKKQYICLLQTINRTKYYLFYFHLFIVLFFFLLHLSFTLCWIVLLWRLGRFVFFG